MVQLFSVSDSTGDDLHVIGAAPVFLDPFIDPFIDPASVLLDLFTDVFHVVIEFIFYENFFDENSSFGI